MKLGEMTLEELVAGEKAAATARRAYEDKMMTYRGLDYNSLSETAMNEYDEASKKLRQLNAVRHKIINEMEARLLDIE